jgi:CRISPR-associated protein (TIGR02710 family)
MSTILVVTVGGSCQPVITAITDYQPQYVYFVASEGARGSRPTVDGTGAPCKGRTPAEDGPSIVAQTGLTDAQYAVRTVSDPDSLQECYAVIQGVLREAMDANLNCRYVADYTGGTKTMSVALAMAALEADWELSLVKGARTDLVKVVDGTEVAGLVNSWEVRARQRMEEARRLFNDHHYAAAESLLGGILQAGAVSTSLQATLREWIGLARGFDAWDRFDHGRAMAVLTPYQSRIVPNYIFLKQIMKADKRSTGYEPAFDLLRNAERRAHQGRYDDAVARLYRASEMFAQIRLRQRTPSLNSSNLDLALLPDHLRERYDPLRDGDDGKIKLGLRQDYELLAALDDPVGVAYQAISKNLLNGLSARNNSILAHGEKPLAESDYRTFASLIKTLFESACAQLKIKIDAPQFPGLDRSMTQMKSA